MCWGTHTIIHFNSLHFLFYMRVRVPRNRCDISSGEKRKNIFLAVLPEKSSLSKAIQTGCSPLNLLPPVLSVVNYTVFKCRTVTRRWWTSWTLKYSNPAQRSQWWLKSYQTQVGITNSPKELCSTNTKTNLCGVNKYGIIINSLYLE